MARDWEMSVTLEAVLERMVGFGPNIADMPLALTMEMQEDGSTIWIVDLHIKVKGVTEFDIFGEGPTPSRALRAAYLGMNDRKSLLRRAEKANTIYGIAV